MDNERLTDRLDSKSPRRGNVQFTNYLQMTTNNVNITNYQLIIMNINNKHIPVNIILLPYRKGNDINILPFREDVNSSPCCGQ